MIYSNDNYNNVRVEISGFESSGVSEYQVLFHVRNTDADFISQLRSIHSACYYVLFGLGRQVRPVFKRYFLSDAANQLGQLENNDTHYLSCATSVVQQPPLDGGKVALWVYLQSGMDEVSVKNNTTRAGHNGYDHFWSAALKNGQGGSYVQTEMLLREYAQELGSLHCTLAENCLRTWFFVQNVDVNYSGVVDARKDFFMGEGLTRQTHYIASTGIEGRTADPEVSVLFDAYAVRGLSPGQIRYLYAPEYLNPTYEYGVTFERGVSVLYGDRKHIFLSGTASIDNKGEIVAPHDISRQVCRMLTNIEALLSEGTMSMSDIAQMIVYLRDGTDYAVVKRLLDAKLPQTPKVIVLAPVCRPGWLVEAECIAIRGCSCREFRPL